MEFEFRSGGKTPKYDLLKIGRGLGYDVDISQVEQRLEIRCENAEGGLELVTSDATVVEMVGHIPSNKILTAVGVDGNNGYFPIAYAVADIESKDSWIWFFNLLIEDLGITNGKAWVVISDKQKGLVPAIETVLPTAEGTCTCH
ncbi:hypothetical protein CerSpe_242920 [Prunus speciosa]